MNEDTYSGERAECADGGLVRGPSQNVGRSIEGPFDMRSPPPQPLPPSTPTIPRLIMIEAKNHGYIVTVGCQTFCVEKISTLIRNVEKYLEHPAEVEQKWLSGKMEL